MNGFPGDFGPSVDDQEQLVAGEVVALSASDAGGALWVWGELALIEGGTGRIRFVGNFITKPDLHAVVELRGAVREHPRYGRQLHCLSWCGMGHPVGEMGARYIAANINACGINKADQILRRLGPHAVSILAKDPSRIVEAFPRASRTLRSRVEAWSQRLVEDEVRERLLLRLAGAGITPDAAKSIVRFFKSADVAEIVCARAPYRLLDVPGFGWARTDEMAQRLGVPADATVRVQAAFSAVLEGGMRSGHTGIPRDALLDRARARLGRVANELVSVELNQALELGLVQEYAGLLYRPSALDLEISFAERTRDLVRQTSRRVHTVGLAGQEVLAKANLAVEQRAAAEVCLSAGVSYLCGLPGSGKTTTLRTLTAAYKAVGLRVQLLAPTGKAAARAGEVTGTTASTIHRALGGYVGSGRPGKLDADLVIVDEAGMVGLEVANWLLESLDTDRTQLIWVGDPNQLPSVEHGNVLDDLILSGVVRGAVLQENHRTRGNSAALSRFARRVLQGTLDVPGDEAVRLSPLPNHKADQQVLEDATLQSAQFGRENAIVLVPNRRYALGMVDLNQSLQETLNPFGEPGPYIGQGMRVRVGDRVIQTRNSYDESSTIFNGETGYVRSVDPALEFAEVDFGDRMVVVSGVCLLSLELAWAVTVHRSQGSEYEAVTLVLPDAAGRLLNRQMLYTGATRARSMLSILSSPGAAERAVATDGARRGTGLAARLREVCAP